MLKYEMETIVNFNEAESTASVYTFNKPMRHKLELLSERYPDDCRLFQISHDGRAAEYYVPKSWIKVVPPRGASEAQKAAARRALQKARGFT